MRMDQVLGWTPSAWLEQVFGKEKGNVVTVLKKQKGCALLPIKDSDPEMPEKMITQITPWDSISWQHVRVPKFSMLKLCRDGICLFNLRPCPVVGSNCR